MPHKFLKHSLATADSFQSGYTQTLLDMIEGNTHGEAMVILESECATQKQKMTDETGIVEHGVHWSRMLIVEQALLAGQGILGW